MKLLKDYDCSIQYHLEKATVVADTLSRKSSSSFAYVSIRRRVVIKKLYDLMDQGVLFQISGEGLLLASIRVHFMLFDRIKAAQSQDPKF